MWPSSAAAGGVNAVRRISQTHLIKWLASVLINMFIRLFGNFVGSKVNQPFQNFAFLVTCEHLKTWMGVTQLSA